jgi:hypothetical protein
LRGAATATTTGTWGSASRGSSTSPSQAERGPRIRPPAGEAQWIE